MSNDSAANASNPRRLRVFLCHSSADKSAVRKLYQRLKADGFEPWLDEEDLLPGQIWECEIPKAVRNSDVVIICFSHGSVNKEGFIQKEIKFALDFSDEKPEDIIFIIPLKLEECEVPERLRRWQWANLFDPNGYNKLLRALRIRAKSLPATIAAPAEEPVAPRLQDGETPQSNNAVSNRSGGVGLKANDVSVGQGMTIEDIRNFIQPPKPRRAWRLLALLSLDFGLIILWGWCLLGDQTNLMAYLQTVFTIVGALVAIVAIVVMTRRPVVLENVLRRLGTDKRWMYGIPVLTVAFIAITLLFWPLGWVGKCCPPPTPTPCDDSLIIRSNLDVKDVQVKVTVKAEENIIFESTAIGGIIEAHVPCSYSGKQVELKIEATGYKPYTEKVRVAPGTPTPQSIHLEPVPTPPSYATVQAFSIVKDGKVIDTVKPNEMITVTAGTAILIRTEVSTNISLTDLLFTWRTCRTGNNIPIWGDGVFEMQYEVMGLDCIRVKIEKGGILLNDSFIFVNSPK